MALIIGTPYSGTGIPFFLALGSNFVLPQGVVVHSTNNYSVDTSTGGHWLTVDGALIGYYGVRLGNNFLDCGNVLTINAAGSVSSTSPTGLAVEVHSSQSAVINQGLIAGFRGIYFSADLGSGSTVTNTGRILSESIAIYTFGNENLSLVNSGTITSYAALSYLGGPGIDRVTNKGTMNGSIDLSFNNDVYEGNNGRVNGSVFGNSSNDILRGGAFTDRLDGGANDDVLTGRGGRDALTGGSNNDIFDYKAVSESGVTATTRDLIFDFNVGNDRIDLSTIDANTVLAGNSAFALLARGTATSAVGAGKIGWYWVDNANNTLDRTFLRINNDADATIEMTIELVGLKSLSGTPGVDFIF